MSIRARIIDGATSLARALDARRDVTVRAGDAVWCGPFRRINGRELGYSVVVTSRNGFDAMLGSACRVAALRDEGIAVAWMCEDTMGAALPMLSPVLGCAMTVAVMAHDDDGCGVRIAQAIGEDLVRRVGIDRARSMFVRRLVDDCNDLRWRGELDELLKQVLDWRQA